MTPSVLISRASVSEARRGGVFCFPQAGLLVIYRDTVVLCASGAAGCDRQRGGIHVVNRRVTVESAGTEALSF